MPFVQFFPDINFMCGAAQNSVPAHTTVLCSVSQHVPAHAVESKASHKTAFLA